MFVGHGQGVPKFRKHQPPKKNGHGPAGWHSWLHSTAPTAHLESGSIFFRAPQRVGFSLKKKNKRDISPAEGFKPKPLWPKVKPVRYPQACLAFGGAFSSRRRATSRLQVVALRSRRPKARSSLRGGNKKCTNSLPGKGETYSLPAPMILPKSQPHTRTSLSTSRP